MSRAVALLLLAAVAVGFAAPPDWRQGEMVLRDSLSRMPAKFRAEWLLRRGLDASRYTEYHRPESTGLRLVGKYGRGPSGEVTGRGNLVALTLGSEVALLNFAKPDSPAVLSEIQLNFIPRQTELHDSFLLTCGNGIEVWNIADSTHPIFRHVIPYGVGDFAIMDTFLFFVGQDTFWVYSIANAANPYQLGRCIDSGYVTTATRNVAVSREPNNVLGFIDVSNPAAPRRVGTYPSLALAADARGSVCCAASYWNTDEDHFRFDVLDISDPANVYRISSIDNVGGYDIHLSGPFAFVSGFQASEWEFTIVDIQDSTYPHVVSSCVTPGDNYGVWADWTSDLAYVADGWGGLAVIDVTNLAAPLLDTVVMTADQAEDIWIDGNRAYVADYRAGMRILDVSDPSQPRELGGVDSINTMCETVVASDSFAFAAWPQPPLFRSLLVSDPTNPILVGGLDPAGTDPVDMVLRDSIVYLVGRFRLRVVNVARPREPALVGSCVIQGTGVDLLLRDTLAYVSSLPTQIVNVRDPANPTVIGIIPTYGNGIAIKDTIAFAPALYDSMVIYNVRDPAAPVRIARHTFTGGHVWNAGVALVYPLLYVGGDTVHMVDVSNPLNPFEVGTRKPPYDTRRLCYQAPYLYAACQEAGVAIYETTQVAIAEPKQVEGQRVPKGASVVRGVLFMPEARGEKLEAKSELRDISGRKVADLHPGANDVRMLAPGVYFVREEPQGLAIRKVILTR